MAHHVGVWIIQNSIVQNSTAFKCLANLWAQHNNTMGLRNDFGCSLEHRLKKHTDRFFGPRKSIEGINGSSTEFGFDTEISLQIGFAWTLFQEVMISKLYEFWLYVWQRLVIKSMFPLIYINEILFRYPTKQLVGKGGDVRVCQKWRELEHLIK